MKKLFNTEAGSFFVATSGQVYFKSFDDQTSKELEEKGLEEGEQVDQEKIKAKIKSELEERQREKDELEKQAAEKAGLGGFFQARR